MADELLTSPETAAYLKVPERTLNDWRYRKIGPPFLRVGRHVRYRRSDVDEWLNTNQAKAS